MGLLTGWINLTNLNGTVGANTLTWIKPASPATTLYPKGFTNVLLVQGEPWVASAVIPPIPESLMISNTGLNLMFNAAVTNHDVLTKLAGGATNSLAGLITLKSGLLTVTFGDGPGKTTATATGVLLQNVYTGGGFFVGKTNAGSMLLQPEVQVDPASAVAGGGH